ncbi:class I SAM-dependent methyltransferase [bacterium]|nr:class I SAM-dependent methyltransferase [bacterium]
MFHEDWYPEVDLQQMVRLYELVTATDGLVIEIGSWEGKSTSALANRCYPDMVHAVDTWEGSPSEQSDHVSVVLAKRRDVYQSFCDNIAAMTRGNVVAHRIDCFEYLASIDQPIKFCHVDGAHDYASVRRSIELALRRLAPGGVLCGHDFLTAGVSRLDLQGGVERAVRELLPGFSSQGNVWWWVAPSNSRVEVYDAFLFSGEFELLELRLQELEEVVDHFVLVESDRTFTGLPKLLKFRRWRHLFRYFDDRLTYIVVDDDIEGEDPWRRESYQRNAIARGLNRAKPTDIIMISDADEVPSRTVISKLQTSSKRITLEQSLHYYWLDCRLSIPWHGTVAMPYALMRSPQEERDARVTNPVMEHGGWHFSYLGGVERIREKIGAFSHQEFNRPPFNTPEWIREQLTNGSDLFGRSDAGFPPTFVDLENDDRYSSSVRWLARRHPYLVNQAVPMSTQAASEDNALVEV